MAHYSGSHKARLEQARRRRAFLARQRAKAGSHRKSHSDSYEDFFEFSEWRMRRIAPIALTIHCCTVLFLISWLITTITYNVSKTTIDFNQSRVAKISIPADNGIYRFKVNQVFPYYQTPLYSELKFEVIDENWDHVYTVYKDLWQESHPNGDGGVGIYKDLEMEFEIELAKAGTYYIRPVSLNANNGVIHTSVSKVMIGGIYFPYYSIFFLALSLIFIFGAKLWGTPTMMYEILPKLRSWKDNRLFKWVTLICIVLFIGSWITAITHYGYASGGDQSVLPTFFYRTNNVIYLG